MENLKHNAEEQEITVERKLIELYTLQQIDSKIDKIRIIRGELPLEVQDLEDEIAGMETRIAKFNEELEKYSNDIVEYKNKIKEATSLIKKYEEQQNNVRNNREYESLTKEIEYQSLDIQLCEIGQRIGIGAHDHISVAVVPQSIQRIRTLHNSLRILLAVDD